MYVCIYVCMYVCMYVEKTKVLISCAVNMQLICAFVFTYAIDWFSPDAAQLIS